MTRMIGAVLLIVGTTIGAGMLAIPVSTGLAGFLPTCVVFLLYWILMTFTALCLVEVALSWNTEVNLISMARATLGKSGAAVTWALYLFLLYALTTAYIAGGGSVLSVLAQDVLGVHLPEWQAGGVLFLLFGISVYKGARAVDLMNRLLMTGLIMTFVWLIGSLFGLVDAVHLERANWSYFYIGLSVIATSFGGAHIVVPTLATYLDRNSASMVKVLLIGSFIPVIVYIVWEFIALGIIPLDGAGGLLDGHCRGVSAAALIAELFEGSFFRHLSGAFSFFAIVTSFLGVSLALSDFLADGLNIEKTRLGRTLLYLLTFVPPALFAFADPRAFLTALEYAGTFGVVLLLGFMPALMVWNARYNCKLPSGYRAPGGKPALIAAMALTLLIIGIELISKIGDTCLKSL